MKQISVILPCYNVENEIDRCLTSIVENSVGIDVLEIICVDDCSTDRTWEKLLDWESRYPDHFIILQNETNGRQGTARNVGLSYATSDWIAFIDSDDWIEKDYFEKLYEHAKTGKYQVITCDFVRDSSPKLQYLDNRENGKVGHETFIITEVDRKNNILMPVLKYLGWGKLIQKNFLYEHNIFFLENLTYEDNYWGLLLNLYVEAVYHVELKLYHYYVNEQSTVLRRNQNHHLDCLTVQSYVWQELQKRNLLEKYRQELEIEHVYSAYLSGMKMLIYRYDEPDYNIYLLLRQLIIERIPDIKNNQYIQAGELDEKYMLMLVALNNCLRKSQFLEFVEQVKKLGI